MNWWIWILFGLFLLVAELFIPTGFFIFLVGIGAILTGLLALIGLAGPPWFHWFLLVVLSTALLIFVRKYMVGRSTVSSSETDRGPQGQEVEISNDIAPGASGEGILRGTVWRVRNDSQAVIRAGSRCVVSSVEGITLIVAR